MSNRRCSRPVALLPVVFAEEVAFATDRLDTGRIVGIVAQFAAQARNAGVDRTVESVEANAAQLLKQIVAREDAAGVAGQQPKQVWHGISTYDSSTQGLTAAEIYRDCENITHSNAHGIALFRYGLGTLPNLSGMFVP